MKHLLDLISSTIDDILIWLFQVLLGVGTKLALESRTKTLTRKYVLTSFIIASFVGYITDRLCTKWGYDSLRGVAVSIMALLSESIVRYFTQNATRILDTIVNAILKKRLGDPSKEETSNAENSQSSNT